MVEFIRTVLLMCWFDLLITVTENGITAPPASLRSILGSFYRVCVVLVSGPVNSYKYFRCDRVNLPRPRDPS